MPGFKAKSAIAPLDYDFRDAVDAHGRIPEPTPDEYDDFLDTVLPLLPENPEDVARLTRQEQRTMQEETLEAVVKLCKGSPSEEEIRALPARLYTAFLAWLMGSFGDPTGANATRR